MDQPLVSIIIPVYNGANYLAEAIDSALAQTYPNIEVLVVDDGSTDESATETIARSYGKRIRYLHKKNGGVATALNHGLAYMEGELFSWLSHDDIYTPEKIARQVEAYLAHDRQAVIYSDAYLMNPAGKTICTRRVPPLAENHMRCALAASNPLHGCALLIPRAFLTEVGGFNPAYRTTQDYAAWFALASKHPFVHVPGAMVGGRIHACQDTHRLKCHFNPELDALCCSFLRALTPAEIDAYTDGNRLRYYAHLFTRYKAYGLTKASALAYSLAKDHQRKGNMMDWLHLQVVARLRVIPFKLCRLMRPLAWKLCRKP